MVTLNCYPILCSSLWRQENSIQQEIATTKDELHKKEQTLRSMTGKVRVCYLFAWIVSIDVQLEFPHKT